MTKEAHITSRPNHQVGDRVLGLCGKEFKVKALWSDLPRTKPICRDCVDSAIGALTEADEVIEFSRVRVKSVERMVERLGEELNPDDLLLDVIAEADQAHADDEALRKAEKAIRKKAKRTCICLWAAGEPIVVQECPVHGKKERAIEDVQLPEPEEKEGE